MVERIAVSILAMATLTGAARPEDSFQPTLEEQARFELMSRPNSWFLDNLAGPPEVIDGQRLDPKQQYYLEARRRRTPEEVKAGLDLFHTPEGRVFARERLAREWALFTKVTAPMRKVEDVRIDARGGPLPLRIYTPEIEVQSPAPILLYFHGGGWLYSSIEAVDRCARLLANEARAIVISVDYRLAPEHPWPAANDDGEDAFHWTLANATRLGGDPGMVGVGGDSAGGNISLSISRRQLAAGLTPPAYQLLYYTSTDFSVEDESFRLFRDGYGLDENFRQFMISLVFPGDALRAASRELSRGSYAGMPPTIVVTAGFDMLRDGGRKLARRLEQDGVATTYLHYPTLAHGFLQWSAVVEDAERAAVDTARLFGAGIRSITARHPREGANRELPSSPRRRGPIRSSRRNGTR